MLTNKHTQRSLCLEKLGYFDQKNHIFRPPQGSSQAALKVSENISQSTLAFRDYSALAYTQLGLCAGSYYYDNCKVAHPDSFFKSIFTSIFNAFDPVDFIDKNPLLLESLTLSLLREPSEDLLYEYRFTVWQY
jgi:hypothetical protein